MLGRNGEYLCLCPNDLDKLRHSISPYYLCVRKLYHVDGNWQCHILKDLH